MWQRIWNIIVKPIYDHAPRLYGWALDHSPTEKGYRAQRDRQVPGDCIYHVTDTFREGFCGACLDAHLNGEWLDGSACGTCGDPNHSDERCTICSCVGQGAI